MRKILLVVFGYFLINQAFGQGYTGPSPDALALMRQANVGVNLYSGTSSIGIPLAELSGRELGVSASLSYNSTGNKVQDVASSEGLGWSLSAGGMITRVVRGIPDDLTNGFCTAGRTDAEPDMFVFSFMGRYGKFVLDAYGNPVLFPFQDIVIKPGICKSSAQTWEIVDENGVRYQFGTGVYSQEKTTSRPLAGGASTSYVSTWFLSKVISANGTDEITFNYTSSIIKHINHFFTKDDHCAQNLSLIDESTEITVNTRYISSITSSGGYMYFAWNSSREDITGGKSLASIRVVNRQGDQTQKVRFEYSYFNTPGCNTQLCKRLRLDRIYDLSSSPLYSFQYNTNVNLPARNSKNFDHWGYFNNNTVDSWIPADPYVGYSGASREPDITKMQANLLVRIVQRSGNYQYFNYEANWGSKNGQTYVVSGARIKSIETGDGRGNTYFKNYSYTKSGSSESSGQLFRLPNYSAYYIRDGAIVMVTRFSHAYSELWDLNGVHVGYSRVVEEETPAKGKAVYTYTNYDTNPDLISGGDAIADSPPFASVNSLFWERGNPKTIMIYNGQNQLLSEEIFEYTFNHPIKKQINGSKSLKWNYNGCGYGKGNYSTKADYKVISRPFTLKKKTSLVYDQNDPNKKLATVTDYGYDPVTYQLISTTRYNAALPAEKYITNHKYVTHPDYYHNRQALCNDQLAQCEQDCESDDCFEVCYDVYDACLDHVPSEPIYLAIKLMRDRHMQNALVEEQKWVERNSVKKLLSARLNLYSRYGQNVNMVIPTASLVSEKVNGTFRGSYVDPNGVFSYPASFKTVQTYNTYDATSGNLLQETGRDGIKAQYVWDHNSTLLKSVTTQGGTLQRTSAYEYKPLVGVIRETDPNGRSVYKEYDDMGRPRLVKGHEGNIIERNRYHYAGETPGFLVNASKQQAVVNESISFSLSDLFVSTGGATKVSWNMGDGRVYDDNRQSVMISYPTAGTYTVSVTVTTNEYPPAIKTIAITIKSPLQVNVCIDGPQRIDMCGIEPPYYGSCTNLNNRPYANTDLHANVVLGTGCSGNYTYYWEYKETSSTYWRSLGTSQKVTFAMSDQEGTFQIRCTVTDVCGKKATGQQYVTYYQSNPDCGGGFFPLTILKGVNEPDEVEGEPEVVEGEKSPIPLPPGIPLGSITTVKDQVGSWKPEVGRKNFQ